MSFRYYYFVLLFLFFGQNVLSQKTAEYDLKYKQAKNYFLTNNITNAKELFAQLENETNSKQAYVWLYLSQINIAQKQFNTATTYLTKIENSNSNIQKTSIFHLLNIKTSLVQKNYTKAINHYQKISSEHSFIWQEIENELVKLSSNEIHQLAQSNTNITQLKILAEQSKQIINVSLPNGKNLKTLKKQNTNGNIFHVSLLLPFEIKQNKRTDKKYLYDFYEGLQAASHMWNLKNKKIEVQIFDVVNNTQVLEQLFLNKTFIQSDLIIGPLHAETNAWLQEYTQVQKIYLINPFSKNHQLVKSKPLSYLATASWYNQILALDQYIVKNYSSKPVFIYQSGDSLALAYLSKKPIAKSQSIILSSLNTESFEKINNAENVLIIGNSKITEKWIETHQTKLLNKSIFMLHDHYKEMKIDNNLNIIVSNPDFIDANNENMIQFNDTFWQKNKKNPSVFTYKGFDLLNYWAKHYFTNNSLFNTGTLFPESNETLLSGFNYKLKENINYNTSIIQIQNNQETFLQRISY